MASECRGSWIGPPRARSACGWCAHWLNNCEAPSRYARRVAPKSGSRFRSATGTRWAERSSAPAAAAKARPSRVAFSGLTLFFKAPVHFRGRVEESEVFWHLRIRPARPPSFEPAPNYQSVSQKEENEEYFCRKPQFWSNRGCGSVTL